MRFYADYVYCPICKIKLYRIVEDLISGMRVSSYHFESVHVYALPIIPTMPLPHKCGKCGKIVIDPCCGIVHTENGPSPQPINIRTRLTRIIDDLRDGKVDEKQIAEYLVYPDRRVREVAQEMYTKYNQEDEE